VREEAFLFFYKKIFNIKNFTTYNQEQEALDLSYHQLRGLPPEIGQLKNLEALDLSYNHFGSLP